MKRHVEIESGVWKKAPKSVDDIVKTFKQELEDSVQLVKKELPKDKICNVYTTFKINAPVLLSNAEEAEPLTVKPLTCRFLSKCSDNEVLVSKLVINQNIEHGESIVTMDKYTRDGFIHHLKKISDKLTFDPAKTKSNCFVFKTGSCEFDAFFELLIRWICSLSNKTKFYYIVKIDTSIDEEDEFDIYESEEDEININEIVNSASSLAIQTLISNETGCNDRFAMDCAKEIMFMKDKGLLTHIEVVADQSNCINKTESGELHRYILDLIKNNYAYKIDFMFIPLKQEKVFSFRIEMAYLNGNMRLFLQPKEHGEVIYRDDISNDNRHCKMQSIHCIDNAEDMKELEEMVYFYLLRGINLSNKVAHEWKLIVKSL